MGNQFADKIAGLYNTMVAHLSLCETCTAARDMRAVSLCEQCSAGLAELANIYAPIPQCSNLEKAVSPYEMLTAYLVNNGDKVRVIPKVVPSLNSNHHAFLRSWFANRRLYESPTVRSSIPLDVLRAIVVRDQLIGCGPSVAQAHFDPRRVYNKVGDFGIVAFPEHVTRLTDLCFRMISDGLQCVRVVMSVSDAIAPFQAPLCSDDLTEPKDIEYQGFRFSYRLSEASELLRVGYLFPVPVISEKAESGPETDTVPVIYSPDMTQDDDYENIRFMSKVIQDLATMNMTFEELKDDILTDPDIRALIVDKSEYLSLVQPDAVALRVGHTMSSPPAPVRYFINQSDVMNDPKFFVTGSTRIRVGYEEVQDDLSTVGEPVVETHCYMSLLKEGHNPPLEGGAFPPTLDFRVIEWMRSQTIDSFVDRACLSFTPISDGVSIHVRPRDHVCDEECHGNGNGHDVFLLLTYAYSYPETRKFYGVKEISLVAGESIEDNATVGRRSIDSDRPKFAVGCDPRFPDEDRCYRHLLVDPLGLGPPETLPKYMDMNILRKLCEMDKNKFYSTVCGHELFHVPDGPHNVVHVRNVIHDCTDECQTYTLQEVLEIAAEWIGPSAENLIVKRFGRNELAGLGQSDI